ncbi:MAG: ATP-binding protein [Clostridia bacterium]
MQELAMHVMDIIQNSVVAGAKLIMVTLVAENDLLTLKVEDDGCGMDTKHLAQVENPFTTSRQTRKVGLGIPLLAEAARASGGSFTLLSERGKGTTLCASFGIEHLDRAPLGELAETIKQNVHCNPQIDFELQLTSIAGNYIFGTKALKESLGTMDLSEFLIIAWISENIEEAVKNIYGGILHEINS